MARFEMSVENLEKLTNAIQSAGEHAEATINDVLHNEAYPLFEDSIKALMPVSGRKWKGKKPPAKASKSTQKKVGNLMVGITTTGAYNYLYFPDDGTNTRKHVGNQQFFLRGVEHQQDEVIDRCVEKLVTNINNSMS